jgi:hypothetical protein
LKILFRQVDQIFTEDGFLDLDDCRLLTAFCILLSALLFRFAHEPYIQKLSLSLRELSVWDGVNF